jgi:hypothetical protein
MIPEALGQTDMGRDLLEQDYILKQITASLIYPENKLGRTFWDRVYAKAREMYGTTRIPVNTFNKVWIMADRAQVFEHNQTAFVVDSHLKVMLEEDYLALQKHQRQPEDMSPAHSITSQIVRAIILPELEKEVNTGKNFANLRQIFNSIILSSWYKRNLKEALLNQVYANKAKVKGIERHGVITSAAKQSLQDLSPEQIYNQYLKAYKRGVFNYIKEDVNNAGEMIPRKYFSGGILGAGAAAHPLTESVTQADSAQLANSLSDPLVDFITGLDPVRGKSDSAMISIPEFIPSHFGKIFTLAVMGILVGVSVLNSKYEKDRRKEVGEALELIRTRNPYIEHPLIDILLIGKENSAFGVKSYVLAVIKERLTPDELAEKFDAEGLTIKYTNEGSEGIRWTTYGPKDSVFPYFRTQISIIAFPNDEIRDRFLVNVIKDIAKAVEKVKERYVELYKATPTRPYLEREKEWIAIALAAAQNGHSKRKLLSTEEAIGLSEEIRMSPGMVRDEDFQGILLLLAVQSGRSVADILKSSRSWNISLKAGLILELASLQLGQDPENERKENVRREFNRMKDFVKMSGGTTEEIEEVAALLTLAFFQLDFEEDTVESHFEELNELTDSRIAAALLVVGGAQKKGHFTIGRELYGIITADPTFAPDDKTRRALAVIAAAYFFPDAAMKARPAEITILKTGVIIGRHGKIKIIYSFDKVARAINILKNSLVVNSVNNGGNAIFMYSDNLEEVDLLRKLTRVITIRYGLKNEFTFKDKGHWNVVFYPRLENNSEDTLKNLSNEIRKFLGAFLQEIQLRRDGAMAAATNLKDFGGIDLNTSNGMQWKVSKDGNGVEMNIDPAMIERVRREGIESLSPVILKITPITSIWPLVGIHAPIKGNP